MNKKDLIEKIALETGQTKARAKTNLDLILNSIRDSLLEGNAVKLSGFGTFKPVARTPKIIVNPRTGVPSKSEPSIALRFVPGQELDNLVKDERRIDPSSV